VGFILAGTDLWSVLVGGGIAADANHAVKQKAKP